MSDGAVRPPHWRSPEWLDFDDEIDLPPAPPLDDPHPEVGDPPTWLGDCAPYEPRRWKTRR